MRELQRNESDNSWTLVALRGDVTAVTFDYALTIVVDAEASVRIEDRFTLRYEGSTFDLDPTGDPLQLAPALRLVRARVDSAQAFDDGSLQLVLENDVRVEVGASQDFEAWTVSCPSGALMVSMPGGELAVWDSPEEDLGNGDS